MAMLFELKQNQAAAMAKADAILTSAENAGRDMTDAESADVRLALAEAQSLKPKIELIESQNTLRALAPKGMILPPETHGAHVAGRQKKQLSTDYSKAFHAWVVSGGENVSAALYEGSNTQGGYAVPIEVDSNIVPLVPPETGVRLVASVLTTTNDIKIPRQITSSTAAFKAESGATANNFTETGPTLDEITLSAFMAGSYVRLSFELAQDVAAFQSFCVNDLINAQLSLEEGWFVNGTGVNQAQGLLGNVGAGITAEPDALGNLVSIDGTLDLMGSLASGYQEKASFLMNRLTGILIRKAQRQANLFEPVWTSVNGKDYLHGRPVTYSAAMPTAARGATPLLYGSFGEGYVIGDRGGAGVNVKVLDQPLALSGQVALLAYRRTDGRVRRPQAIQSYTIAAS